MKKETKTALWIVVAVFVVIAVRSFSGSSSDPNTRNLVEGLGRVIGTVFGVAAAGLGALLLLVGRARGASKNQDGDQHSGREEPDDPSVAAKHAQFWKIVLGAASVGLVAGLSSFLAAFSGPIWLGQVVPFVILLVGGFFLGLFSRPRPWLVSICLIVPGVIPWLFLMLYDGESPGVILILIGAIVAGPLIGVGLALALTRFRR